MSPIDAGLSVLPAMKPVDRRAGARRTALTVGALALSIYVGFLIKAAFFGL